MSLAFSDSDNETKKIDKITKLNTLKNSKINSTPSIPKNNPLLTDLDDTDPVSKRSMKAELWFQKDSFKDIDEEDDEGVDLDKLAETYREKGILSIDHFMFCIMYTYMNICFVTIELLLQIN